MSGENGKDRYFFRFTGSQIRRLPFDLPATISDDTVDSAIERHSVSLPYKHESITGNFGHYNINYYNACLVLVRLVGSQTHVVSSLKDITTNFGVMKFFRAHYFCFQHIFYFFLVSRTRSQLHFRFSTWVSWVDCGKASEADFKRGQEKAT